MNLFTKSNALISDCGSYRYWLKREWEEGELLAWVMLNPSTADATEDDPTIRRCIGFSQSWGFGGLVVVNLYALRATDPRQLWKAPDAAGPDNDIHLEHETWGRHVIAAWGAYPKAMDRAEKIHDLIKPNCLSLQCLGVTKEGFPRHPLYVAGKAQRSVYEI